MDVHIFSYATQITKSIYLMLKEKEDKHTTIRGKDKNPEVEKVTKKRLQCKFNTFSLRTKSHMRYIVYAINRICDICDMENPFPLSKNLKFNIAYAIYCIYDISHMRFSFQ